MLKKGILYSLLGINIDFVSEKKAAQEAAAYFVRRAKDILGKASEELDEELRQTFESYPHDAVRLAKLIRSYIRFSRRAPFANSGFVSTFLCCEFAKLYGDKK